MAANDPKRTSASISCCSSEAGFSPYQSTRLSRYDAAPDHGADMRRRDFLGVLGGVAAAWPLAVSAQQAAMPVIGFLNGHLAGRKSRSSAWLSPWAARNRISPTAQNVVIEYRWAENEPDRLPSWRRSCSPRCCADRGGFSTGRVCCQGGKLKDSNRLWHGPRSGQARTGRQRRAAGRQPDRGQFSRHRAGG